MQLTCRPGAGWAGAFSSHGQLELPLVDSLVNVNISVCIWRLTAVSSQRLKPYGRHYKNQRRSDTSHVTVLVRWLIRREPSDRWSFVLPNNWFLIFLMIPWLWVNVVKSIIQWLINTNLITDVDVSLRMNWRSLIFPWPSRNGLSSIEHISFPRTVIDPEFQKTNLIKLLLLLLL